MTTPADPASPHRIDIRVHYPLTHGRVVLRTEADWDSPVQASHVSKNGHTWSFVLATDRPYLYYKPCIETSDRVIWSRGNNYLASAELEYIDVYPHFHGTTGGSIGDLIEVGGDADAVRKIRCYYPPGYHENPLQRFPVLYMHDGQNLFSPDEAFLGSDWQVEQTLETLDAMNLVRRCIVVGIYSKERAAEYTAPGYEAYGRFLVDEIKEKTVDRSLRTLSGPHHTAVMGSSLGGVVSLFLAWQWPETFGMAACMSSTFTWRDNLRERIHAEPRRNIRIYLDSGWPGDNYEVTRSMRDLLMRRGYRYGRDLMYFAFPGALHNEKYWAMRAHIPFQFFFGDAG